MPRCWPNWVTCCSPLLEYEAWQVHGERVTREPEPLRRHHPAAAAQLRGRHARGARGGHRAARRAGPAGAAELLAGVDALVGPAVAFAAPEQTPPVDTAEGEIEGLFTAPYNVSGQPALVLPCGATDDGLPVALQLAGPVGDDAGLLRVAAAVEALLEKTA